MLVTDQTPAKAPMDMATLARQLGVSGVTLHRLAETGLIAAGPARGPGRPRMVSVVEQDRIARTLKAAQAVGLPLPYAFRPNARLDGSRLVFEPQEQVSAV